MNETKGWQNTLSTTDQAFASTKKDFSRTRQSDYSTKYSKFKMKAVNEEDSYTDSFAQTKSKYAQKLEEEHKKSMFDLYCEMKKDEFMRISLPDFEVPKETSVQKKLHSAAAKTK